MRTTDERDRDSARHREIMDRLDRIEQRLGIIEQQLRHRQEAAGGPGFSARQAQRVEEGW